MCVCACVCFVFDFLVLLTAMVTFAGELCWWWGVRGEWGGVKLPYHSYFSVLSYAEISPTIASDILAFDFVQVSLSTLPFYQSPFIV